MQRRPAIRLRPDATPRARSAICCWPVTRRRTGSLCRSKSWHQRGGGRGRGRGVRWRTRFCRFGGPVGAFLSVFAQFGLAAWSAHERKEAQNAPQSQGQDFLGNGLHIRPEVAHQLADVSDPREQGPGPVLLAYARQYGIKPQALLEYLNKQNPTDVGGFVYLAALVTPDENGRSPVSSPSDTSKRYYIPHDFYQNSVEFSPYTRPPEIDSMVTPTTLQQLHYWAKAIFGAGGPPATSSLKWSEAGCRSVMPLHAGFATAALAALPMAGKAFRR